MSLSPPHRTRKTSSKQQYWQKVVDHNPLVNMVYVLPWTFRTTSDMIVVEPSISNTDTKMIDTFDVDASTTLMILEETGKIEIQVVERPRKSSIVMLTQPNDTATTHIRPSFIYATMDGVPLKGAAINILPFSEMCKLGKHMQDLVPTKIFVNGFSGDVTSTRGILPLEVTIVTDDVSFDIELAQAVKKRDAIERVLKFFVDECKFKAEHAEINWEDVIYDADLETDGDVIELNELAVAADKLEDGSITTKDLVIPVDLGDGMFPNLPMFEHAVFGCLQSRQEGDIKTAHGAFRKNFPSRILWKIWKSCNKIIYDGAQSSVQCIIHATMKHVRSIMVILDLKIQDDEEKEFFKTVLGVNLNRIIRARVWKVPWVPPAENSFILNTDGSSRLNDAGYGKCGYLEEGDSFKAEIIGGLFGLRKCDSLGLHHVTLQTDNKTLAEISKLDKRLLWKYYSILHEMIYIIRKNNFQVLHIYRKVNLVADRLANCVSYGSSKMYSNLESLPRVVKGLLILDQSSFPYIRTRFV
ncbi:OLC1v1036877C1 [Oldenlandia corymbosa var. corymbosa]|uniref:OLC1v1036877C1 n=1 Tax=Oldenlandia corymbosa var. corymbosa TaxID=529605 RepID=A0AAV1CZK4_OLDCO|nr:OLC1v1036877C1 [Oldenlandia corymbosa var. corymbosa]